MRRITLLFAMAVIVIVAIPYLILSFLSLEKGETIPGNDSGNNGTANRTISVYMVSEKRTIELPLEEYVTCVVASELPAGFEKEALKAQAVASRTYGIARQGSLCNTVHCQVFETKETIARKKGEEWMNTNWEKIESAVKETEGQVLYYDGKLASQVMFHSSTGGRTENSEEVFVSAVPYLRSVSSPYENEATHRDDEYTFTVYEFADVINNRNDLNKVTAEDVKNMKITKRTEGGNVACLKIGQNELDGKTVRNLFNLASANFRIHMDETNVVIISTGYGHGVGMSQYGANGMAKKGYNYKQILKHYYKGIEIKQLQ